MIPRFLKTSFGIMVIVFAAAFNLTGCDGAGPGEVDDFWHPLFDTEFSWVIEPDPPYFTTETPVDIAITVRPRESGVGHFSFIGENPENGADGEMLSPVTGEVGTVAAPVAFVAGEPTTLVWRIQLNEVSPNLPYDGVRFQLYAGFDSVLVDSTLYPLGAPELSAQFGSGFPGFSRMLNLEPPEE